MAANLFSEITGLFFTLIIFIVLLEFREVLEWKAVEDRVKKRIGRGIYEIFFDLLTLCEVERRHGEFLTEENWRMLREKQLNILSSGKVKLLDFYRDLDVWRKEDFASKLASILDSRRAYLSAIEGKYLKFLRSDLQASLMDIQDYLHDFNGELRIGLTLKGERFFDSISDLIWKIMVEIAKIREQNIDIGF